MLRKNESSDFNLDLDSFIKKIVEMLTSISETLSLPEDDILIRTQSYLRMYEVFLASNDKLKMVGMISKLIQIYRSEYTYKTEMTFIHKEYLNLLIVFNLLHWQD